MFRLVHGGHAQYILEVKVMDTIKRIKLVVLILLVISVFIPSLVAFAYFTDGDSTVNSASIGGNNITIIEAFEPEPIEPGQVIHKEVQIHNEGPNRCYVRARVVFSDSIVGEYADIDWNLTDWVYNASDEYYYYTSSIEKNESTSCLMTTISLDDNMPQENVKDVEVIVYAESYQAEGFDSYQEAWEDYVKNMK